MMTAEAMSGPTLGALLAECCPASSADRPVAGLALDSRRVVAGGAFVALPGTRTHGFEYLDEALDRGASTVLYAVSDPEWTVARQRACETAGALAVAVPDLARRLGAMAARMHGDPADRLESVIAVTGTDGKTSVTHFIAAMLDEPERPAGVLGTLGRGRVGATDAAGLTTPDAIGLQEGLAALADAGIRRVALEASSHGLAQHRLDGTRIDIAVLTHLGRDHLDYHADAAAYAAAKARLFTWPGLRAAVLNTADAFGRECLARLAADARAITYGGEGAELVAADIRCHPAGLAFELVHGASRASVAVPLLGPFNVDNLLAAAGALLALDYPLADIAARMARVRPIPGRMELFRVPGRPGVVVDYAHNAGALETALAALRAHTAGRVWCVFGAGGDRDRGKRPLMGAAACAGADRVIVTDDNPRSEPPGRIVAEILAGMPDGGAAQVQHNRERALALAVSQAGENDLILLAGKGHETTQTRGSTPLPWSDRAAARRALGQPSAEGP